MTHPPAMRWTVPVQVGRETADLEVYVSHGEVVMTGPPRVACIVPPDSDAQLCEALRAARAVAEEMERT